MQGTINPSYVPVLLTGAFALGGVLIGLLFSSLERVRERKIAIRKEVYLQASEAMANYQHYLAKFANLKLANEEHRDLLDKALPTFKKIHVVASFDTIKKFDAVFLFIVETSYALGSLRYERSQIESKIQNLNLELEAMKKLPKDTKSESEPPISETSNHPPNAGGQLMLDKLREERTKLTEDWRRSHRVLQEAASRADLEFLEYFAQALLASRREMGLALPEKDYMGMIYKGSKRISQAFHKAIEKRDEHNTTYGPSK